VATRRSVRQRCMDNPFWEKGKAPELTAPRRSALS
jgi:hypothetical protein